ncbi:unnamed protein product [Amoebophrya sp. A25]|nr:unnamed protein product [Amoebophrya sp. A25]|eukprot:GSA25T00009405001.1
MRDNRHERPPGSLRCFYLFYARLYEKLIAKQGGRDVPFFSNVQIEEEHSDALFPTRVDLSDRRCIGMREILDFSRDMGLRPHKVGIKDLERCYFAAHSMGLACNKAGEQGDGASMQQDDNSQASSNARAAQEAAFVTYPGLTYHEFLKFLVYLTDVLDENSAKDKLVMRDASVGRVQRVRRLASYLQCQNVRKVRLVLQDAWRQTHYWKLEEDMDLTKYAKTLQQQCIPKQRVKPLYKYASERDKHMAQCLHQLERFTWTGDGAQWEAFPLPYLDMGVSRIGERKSFKVVLTNKCTHLMRLSVRPDEALEKASLRLPVGDEIGKVGLPMGASASIIVEPWPVTTGEWCGNLLLKGETKAGQTGECKLPVYMKFVIGGSIDSSCFLNNRSKTGANAHPLEGGLAAQHLRGLTLGNTKITQLLLQPRRMLGDGVSGSLLAAQHLLQQGGNPNPGSSNVSQSLLSLSKILKSSEEEMLASSSASEDEDAGHGPHGGGGLNKVVVNNYMLSGGGVEKDNSVSVAINPGRVTSNHLSHRGPFQLQPPSCSDSIAAPERFVRHVVQKLASRPQSATDPASAPKKSRDFVDYASRQQSPRSRSRLLRDDVDEQSMNQGVGGVESNHYASVDVFVDQSARPARGGSRGRSASVSYKETLFGGHSAARRRKHFDNDAQHGGIYNDADSSSDGEASATSANNNKQSGSQQQGTHNKNTTARTNIRNAPAPVTPGALPRTVDVTKLTVVPPLATPTTSSSGNTRYNRLDQFKDVENRPPNDNQAEDNPNLFSSKMSSQLQGAGVAGRPVDYSAVMVRDIDPTKRLPYFAPKPFVERKNKGNLSHIQFDPRSQHNMAPRTARLYPGKTNL